MDSLREYKMNFEVSMMMWFRFIECIICSCIYLNHLMTYFASLIDPASQQQARLLARNRHRQQAAAMRRQAFQFVAKKMRKFDEKTDALKTCSICLEDFKTS